MEKVKKRTLKRSFIYSMMITTVSVVIFSVITILICLNIQNEILPDFNTATLKITTAYEDGTQQTVSQNMEFGATEEVYQIIVEEPVLKSGKPVQYYSIDKIDNGLSSLSARDRNIYMTLSALMVLLPSVYSISGIVLCAIWFYKKKLNPPIKTLSFAAEQIAQKDLDFKVEMHEENELGLLCTSFETMREALYENNKQLLSMLEERRMLQASVAHDLRNPICIIEGYTEYLQSNMEEDRFSKDEILHMISNIETAAKRLERYTNSIQDIFKLEDLEIKKKDEVFPDALDAIVSDFSIMAEKKNKIFKKDIQVPQCNVKVDMQIIYRVLENIFTNSLRFAQKEISMSIRIEEGHLKVVIKDDGNGFNKKVLNSKNKYTITMNSSDKHMEMGLIISRILCKKYGGFIDYYNAENGGAIIKVAFSIC